MGIAPGTEIAGHRVIDRFHEGGMADLYRVAAPDGEVRLLKLPKLGFGSHSACYAGFEVEQISLSRLSGPHVPRLYASGEHAGSPYLICEHLGDDTLAARMEGAPLPPAETARLGAALAMALSAIHRQGVVHHDLKPSHVFFRPGGEAALIDFGLACHGQLPDLVEDEADKPLGTPAYISPEQLRARRCDPRSDIFAIGIVLYAMASGRLPFGSPTGLQGMNRRLYFDCTPPRRINPDCPGWLQEIILHCLEVNVERRYGSAAQLANDLAHPDQVAVGDRGERQRSRGWHVALRRGWRYLFGLSPGPLPPAVQLPRAPHLLVAVDTAHADDVLQNALRQSVKQLAATAPQWRITCVTVIDPSLLGGMEDAPEVGRTAHTETLIALHHWAQPLDLPVERLRFHVLEGGDAAARIVDFVRTHHVDQVVLGARGGSHLRRLLGSVSARVAAEAPCTVTVVRAP
jgi:protein-serine/threonine kinase